MVFIDFFIKNKEKLLKFANIGLMIIIIFVITKYAGRYFSPFILGYILSIILYPIFKFFHIKNKLPKNVSGILCILLLIFLVSFLGVGIVGQVAKEGKEFAKNMPFYIDGIKNTFSNIEYKTISALSVLPDSIENGLINFYDNFKYFIGEFLGSGIKSSSVEIIKKIPNTFMIIVIGIISCHFFLVDKNNIENFVIRQFPKKYLAKINTVKKGISKSLFGYIKAQIIIMCLVSTVCFIGLSIIRSPYTLLVALIIGVIDAFPIFGSGFILWPLAIYNFILGNYTLSIGLMVIYLVILILRQSVEPKILGNQIGIHPLATLLSIYVGIKIFGFLGFIVGPTILVIIKALQNEDVLPNWK